MGSKWGQLQRGVSIKTRLSGVDGIQLQFRYKGVRCRELLSIPASKANVKYANNLLGEIKNKIERDTFHYAEYFPESKRLQTFGITTSKTTVLHYLDELILSGEKKNFSHTTINGYKKCKRALSDLHDILASKLTPKEVSNWIKRQDKTVSGKTIKNRKSVLELALDQAVIEGVCQYNAARQVNASQYITVKKVEDARNQQDEFIDAFTPAELQAIYQHCKPVELNIIQFWVNTGVRSGEWAALKWEDIDFVQQQVHIIESLSEGITKGTKTKAGRRVIPLNDEAVNALKRQKAHTFLQNGHVFLNRAGQPWDHESFRKHRWQANITRLAGVRYRKPYNFRHTFATKHISQGENLWKIATWLGHSSVEMLYKHYGHFIEAYEKEKVSKTERNDTDMTLIK